MISPRQDKFPIQLVNMGLMSSPLEMPASSRAFWHNRYFSEHLSNILDKCCIFIHECLSTLSQTTCFQVVCVYNQFVSFKQGPPQCASRRKEKGLWMLACQWQAHICLQSQPWSHPSVGVVMANSLESQRFQPHISKKTMFLVLPWFQFGGVLLSLLFKKEQLFFAAIPIWLPDHSCPEAGPLGGGLHLWESRNLHTSSLLPKIQIILDALKWSNIFRTKKEHSYNCFGIFNHLQIS